MKYPFYFLFFILFTSCASQLYTENTLLERIETGFSFTEGPAVHPNGDVYFTDQPNNAIHRWNAETNEITLFMADSGRSNGLYFTDDGLLLACADNNFEIWEIHPNTNKKVLLHQFDGQHLNGPNDLWLTSKGGIYFTDPYYQRPWWQRTEKEIEEERVYYLAPNYHEVKAVATNFEQPNGIIGSADGKYLYVADIDAKKTYRFDINTDATLTNRTEFAPMGSDGMTVDNKGNVYLTGDGVTVFNKNGKKIDHISVPEKWTGNVTFGGKNEDILFITASTSVYKLPMKVHGVRFH